MSDAGSREDGTDYTSWINSNNVAYAAENADGLIGLAEAVPTRGSVTIWRIAPVTAKKPRLWRREEALHRGPRHYTVVSSAAIGEQRSYNSSGRGTVGPKSCTLLLCVGHCACSEVQTQLQDRKDSSAMVADVVEPSERWRRRIPQPVSALGPSLLLAAVSIVAEMSQRTPRAIPEF